MQVIVNSTHEDLKHPGKLIIDFPFCLDWFENSMSSDFYQLEPDTIALARIVFDDVDIKEDNWETLGNGIVSMIARIDLTLKMQLLDMPAPVWRYPESGIYPKYVVNIPDLMMEIGFFGKDPSKPRRCDD